MNTMMIDKQPLSPSPILTSYDPVLENMAPEVLKPTTQRDLRSLAFHFMYAVDRFDYSITLEEVLENFKVAYNLEIDDDSFAIKLARGAIDNHVTLDEHIKPLLKNWAFERLGVCTRLILRIALWELDQKEVAPTIAINEAIELAKAYAERDSYKFVNGILDEWCKLKQINTEDLVDAETALEK